MAPGGSGGRRAGDARRAGRKGRRRRARVAGETDLEPRVGAVAKRRVDRFRVPGARRAEQPPRAHRRRRRGGARGEVRRVDPSPFDPSRVDGNARLVRRVSVSTGGVHRSSPRARLGRASFFESVVRPTSRRFLGPDTWAFLTRPSRVVPLDDRQRLVFVASILRRTRAPAAPGERLGAVAPAQNARAHRRTRAPREAPNAGDRPPGIARERSRARERRSRGAGSGSGVAAGVSARTIVG